MTATRLVLGVVGGALLGLGGGYALWHQAADAAPAAAATPDADAAAEPGTVELDEATVRRLGIVTAPAVAAMMVPTFAAPGRLLADPSAAFAFRVPLPGRLVAGPQPLPAIGELVAADRVVAVLQPRLTVAERADLAQRRAQAQADVEAAGAAMVAAASDLERARTLHAAGNAASARAVEQAELELRTQTARQAAAQQVLSALPEVGAAGVALTLPRTGVVDEVLAHLGEEVEAGAGVLQLSDPDRLLARIDVPAGAEVDDGLADASLELLGAVPTTVVARRLAWVAGSGADRALLLGLPATADTLRPGLPVVAHLRRRAAPLAGVQLPDAAILRRSDGAWVFVREGTAGGTATFRRLPVQLDAPSPGGWLCAPLDGGPTAGADLVTAGAGALLSIERQRAADAAAGG